MGSDHNDVAHRSAEIDKIRADICSLRRQKKILMREHYELQGRISENQMALDEANERMMNLIREFAS